MDPDAKAGATDAVSLRRSMAEEDRRAYARPLVAAVVSAFLFAYVGTPVATVWLSAVLVVEAVGFISRRRALAGDDLFTFLVVPNTLITSLLWVVHAVLLWRVGGDIPRIAALMDLFTVALYAVIGVHKNLRLMLALLAPPLVTMTVVLVGLLYAEAGIVVASFGTLATLGAGAMILINGILLHRSDRQLFGALATLKATSEDLRASKAFLDDVSQIAALGGWRIDLATKHVELSRSARMMFELPDAAAPELDDLLDCFPEDPRRRMETALAAAAAHGSGWDLEFEARTASGRQLFLRVVGRVMEAEDGAHVLVGAMQDVTARVETERALAALAEDARAANVAKDGFLANMSHEIRTPLNGVVSMAAALLDTELAPRQREMTELIHRSGDTLERLLSDLLDISKIESGRLEIVEERFDLSQSVRTAADIMAAVAAAKGIAFSVSVDPAAEGWFVGDSLRLRQIVANLVSNAVKFTDHGSVALGVTVEAPVDEGPPLVRIAVKDTGVGFDADVAERLFQRFEQGDGSITRRFGGTGLGLSISQALATRMGGRIEALSAPGCGATFTLALPLARCAAPASDAQSDAQRGAGRAEDCDVPGAAADTRRVRVLVAEDHPVNRRAFQLILETLGMEMVCAVDGAEAVRAAEAGGFDLILMDMQMPRMDGLSATRAIRASERERRRPRTPIAMVSANAMSEHVALALEAGCDFHVAKPITPARLAEGVRRALALNQAAAATAAA